LNHLCCEAVRIDIGWQEENKIKYAGATDSETNEGTRVWE
jgi:hypothetical protein